MNVSDVIKNAISTTGHHPFLFIGSGFSKRYLGSEKWDELLRYFCAEFSNNEFQYDIYANQVTENTYYGKQPAIASLLEKDYNNAVLTLDKYKDFRTKYKVEIQNGISSLKIAVSNHLDSYTIPKDNEELETLRKMAKRSVSGIITTNYDNLLDYLFPQFDKYIGQEELVFANISGIGEIYKIHGSIQKPDSLILTSKDYETFEAKSSYLIAKLITIFLEYPVIFLGYSLSDRNIENIFSTIADCLSQEKLNSLKSRLIFVDYSQNEVVSEYSKSFNNGNSIRMNRVSTSNFLEIYKAILNEKSKYNPSILRQLRKDIYSLASSTAVSDKIVATGFENLDDISKINQFILGVGISNHGHIIKAEQLYEDVVFDNKYFNPVLVVEEYLPDLLKYNVGGLPMHKYLKDYDKSLFGNVKENFLKLNSIDSFLNGQLLKLKKTYRENNTNLNIKSIISSEGEEKAYEKIIFLNQDEIDLNELLSYLQKILKQNPKLLKNNTNLKRLIKMYDFIKYNKSAPSNLSNSANT